MQKNRKIGDFLDCFKECATYWIFLFLPDTDCSSAKADEVNKRRLTRRGKRIMHYHEESEEEVIIIITKWKIYVLPAIRGLGNHFSATIYFTGLHRKEKWLYINMMKLTAIPFSFARSLSYYYAVKIYLNSANTWMMIILGILWMAII